MRYVFMALLFLCASVSFAQKVKEVTTDTTYFTYEKAPADWIGTEDSIFYETRIVSFSTGRSEIIKEPIGPSATLKSASVNRNVDISRQVSEAAAVTIQRDVAIRAFRTADKALVAVGIGSVFAELDSLFWKEYLNTSNQSTPYPYKVSISGTADQSATLRRLGNGNIRLSIGQNNYQCIILGDRWLRIKDYPTVNQWTDVFKTGKNRWDSVNGTNSGVKVTPLLTLKKG